MAAEERNKPQVNMLLRVPPEASPAPLTEGVDLGGSSRGAVVGKLRSSGLAAGRSFDVDVFSVCMYGPCWERRDSQSHEKRGRTGIRRRGRRRG